MSGVSRDELRRIIGKPIARLGAIEPDWASVVPPVAGYAMWYDFGNPAQVTRVSGAISAVNDGSPNNNDLAQATAANRPSFVKDPKTGLTLAYFDGVNDRLTSSATVSDLSSTWFCVGQVADIVGGTRAIIGPNANGGFELREGGGWLALSADTASLGGSAFVAPSDPGEMFALAVILSTSVTYYQAAGGVLQSSTAAAHGQSLTAGRTLVVGAAPSVGGGAGEWWKGLVGEMIQYTTVLTDDEIRQVLAYLIMKWKIKGFGYD